MLNGTLMRSVSFSKATASDVPSWIKWRVHVGLDTSEHVFVLQCVHELGTDQLSIGIAAAYAASGVCVDPPFVIRGQAVGLQGPEEGSSRCAAAQR